MLTLPMLTDATATGRGPTVAPELPEISVQAWISGGSATVVLLASNDDRARTAPDTAAWDTLATFTLSGDNDQAALRDVVPLRYLAARVDAVAGGAVVNCKLGV